MYMYLSPLVSVVRNSVCTGTHQGTRIRQIFWGVARYWYGMVIGIGIGMHSETDWNGVRNESLKKSYVRMHEGS